MNAFDREQFEIAQRVKAAADYGKQIANDNRLRPPVARKAIEVKKAEKFGYFFRVAQSAEDIANLFEPARILINIEQEKYGLFAATNKVFV